MIVALAAARSYVVVLSWAGLLAIVTKELAGHKALFEETKLVAAWKQVAAYQVLAQAPLIARKEPVAAKLQAEALKLDGAMIPEFAAPIRVVAASTLVAAEKSDAVAKGSVVDFSGDFAEVARTSAEGFVFASEDVAD